MTRLTLLLAALVLAALATWKLRRDAAVWRTSDQWTTPPEPVEWPADTGIDDPRLWKYLT
jgi:hypothetical protein